jgi:hypothetical protein
MIFESRNVLKHFANYVRDYLLEIELTEINIELLIINIAKILWGKDVFVHANLPLIKGKS